MQRQRNVWGLKSLVLPLGALALAGVSCDPKVNPAFDPWSDAIAIGDGPMPDDGGSPADGPPGDLGENGPGDLGETPPPVTGLEPGASVNGQSGGSMATEGDGDAGALFDAGFDPVCVPSGPRDCSSELDNDCDGQPDNVVDDVCVCVVGAVEPCDEHPGLDGNGPCRAGTRTCVLAADGFSTEWESECVGSVGPAGPDSCTERGDDADCDGSPNTGCPCIDGETQDCGTDTGPCSLGTSTCVNGQFQGCVGGTRPAAQDSCVPGDDSNCNGRANDRPCACFDGEVQECGVTDTGSCALGTRTCTNGVFSGACVGSIDPRARDCRSGLDNDCDGRADNALDNACRCSIGATQACETHPQDGVGRCRAGTQQCTGRNNNSSSDFGACTGSVGPGARDCRSAQDNDCDGRPDNSCSDDPNNARCNGQGQCVPCQSNPDCSLVSGGRNTCQSGRCVACSGCAVNGACVADGANHPTELCQVCDASTKTFEAALDGSVCSFTPPASCLSGRCDLPEAFECSASISTATTLAPLPSVFVQNPNPVVQNFEPSAGVLNGRYLVNSVESESQVAPVVGELIEFRDRDKAYRRMRTTYVSGQPVSTVVDIGSYGLNVDSVTLNGTECGGGATPIAEQWRYNSAGFFLNVSRQSGRVEVFTPTTL